MAHLRDDESNDQVAATTETPGQRLAHLRQIFNPENVLRSSKAQATFNKHPLFIYENNPELLHQQHRSLMTSTPRLFDITYATAPNISLETYATAPNSKASETIY
jgi:hypothetical protein